MLASMATTILGLKYARADKRSFDGMSISICCKLGALERTREQVPRTERNLIYYCSHMYFMRIIAFVLFVCART